MALSNYNSFEANELHMATLSSDEAEAISLLQTDGTSNFTIDSAIRTRSQRRRLVSMISIVLALVGITLLVSISSAADSTSPSPSNMKISDMRTFESISGESSTVFWIDASL